MQFKTVKNGFHQFELKFLVQFFIEAGIDRTAGIVQFKLTEFQHIPLIMSQYLLKHCIIAVFRLYDGVQRYTADDRSVIFLIVF